MTCAADAGSTRCAVQNAARLTIRLLTPTTPKRTTDTSERRRTIAGKPDVLEEGGVGESLIRPRTGPFCSTGRKPSRRLERWGGAGGAQQNGLYSPAWQ